MNVKLRVMLVLSFCLLVAGCANMNGGDQLLPEKSRATPELALLSQKAQLADAGNEAAKAEALYKAILRQTPNDADIWYRLGNLYANNNRPAEAAIAYERTLVSDNSNARAWHNLAIIRLRQSYASMLQANLLVDESDPLAERIDRELDEYARITIIEGQPRPAKGAKPAKAAPEVNHAKDVLVDVPPVPPVVVTPTSPTGQPLSE